ncbi:hypothetical protein P4O66_012732 [Electrophorus voltai]|uniref:Uncharacterized protein n=1 Tax=Electrophorus voltai TaxID=2609070 RepID=A0AAD8Z7D9_9TELE|nr:hypothetical protein P4O66_012732 [Electrophorus voltai]
MPLLVKNPSEIPLGGGRINRILDDLLSRLELYACNLEEVVREQKKAEGLLTQMLPRYSQGWGEAVNTACEENYPAGLTAVTKLTSTQQHAAVLTGTRAPVPECRRGRTADISRAAVSDARNIHVDTSTKSMLDTSKTFRFQLRVDVLVEVHHGSLIRAHECLSSSPPHPHPPHLQFLQPYHVISAPCRLPIPRPGMLISQNSELKDPSSDHRTPRLASCKERECTMARA